MSWKISVYEESVVVDLWEIKRIVSLEVAIQKNSIIPQNIIPPAASMVLKRLKMKHEQANTLKQQHVVKANQSHFGTTLKRL